jgi:hypothetical protein
MMKKSILSIAFALGLGFASEVQAQKMHEMCGTTEADQDILIQRLNENRDLMEKGLLVDNARGAKKYVPVKFHIVGKADGSGRINEAKILENLCQINKDYADQDIVFYLKVETNGDIFNYINNDNVFANQSNSLGITSLNKEYKKFPGAINLFLVNFASSENQLGGTTLGYYSPINDWLVIRNDQVNSTSGTISHELGHHFSLPHPFKGWDQKTCKDIYPTEWASGKEFQVTILKAPDGNTTVENADKSNCKTAGDNICDTPADYNFGFDWNGCTLFTKKIKDPAGNYLDPEETLFMGYFIGCAKYVFTTDQKALILADYLSAKRAKLRPNYTPNIVDVTGKPNLVSPAAGSTTGFYNNITFDWDDVPGADRYILEIDKNPSFNAAPIRSIEKTSMKVVTNLAPDVLKYYWRVIPFHSETGTCVAPGTLPKIIFSTSAISSAKDISGVSDWTVSPNPVTNGNAIVVDVDVTQPFEAEVSLINSVGQKVQTLGNQQFTEGGNRLEIATKDVSAGIYFVRLQTGKSIVNKKVVVLN